MMNNTSWTELKPSPIQEVNLPLLREKGVQLMIKREDLLHPSVNGNKWRKLYGSLLKADSLPSGVITFGGAFSNHIHATAAACHLLGIPCVGIIRGEEDYHNPTLTFVKEKGMQLHFVSRAAYREKVSHPHIQEIIMKYPHYLVIPEGGSNMEALVGLEILAKEVNQQVNPDIITVSAGTGMTASGIVKYADHKVEVYPALKSLHLKSEIENWSGTSAFTYVADYHFGGYGKTPDTLIKWINDFARNTTIPLDPIYNGKAVYGVLDRVEKGMYQRGASILHIHTGGLQGIAGYNYMARRRGKTLITT